MKGIGTMVEEIFQKNGDISKHPILSYPRKNLEAMILVAIME